MPKRKRSEPSLEEKISQWEKELCRGLKTAKGFERQRYAKRIRDSPPEKVARLEKEVLVLKSLDLHQAAHAHLCSSLLKIKGVAESPKLPAQIKPVPKPSLSEEEQTALHNVTSALCNRKQVKGVIEQAVIGTCIALRVAMPDKKGKAKGKDKEKKDKAQKGEQAGDINRDGAQEHKEEAESHSGEASKGLVLLKKLEELQEGDDKPGDKGGPESSDGEVFEGLSDSDAEERAFSRYDDLLGGSSEDDSGDEASEDDDEQEDLYDSRSRPIRRVSAPASDDGISISSAEESEGSSAAESEADSLPPPPKKAKMKAARTEPIKAGNSAFLPTLMGGYISGSESASDVDVAPAAKKNRRGQRARQAIWEKKYGDKAKHKQKQTQPKDSRDQGWDMRRGAVDAADDARPWKKGIQNPFEKSSMHPERMRHIESGHKQEEKQERSQDKERSSSHNNRDTAAQQRPPPPKPKQEPTRDDTGPLHPSWAAAKKAKEEGQKIAFQGRKITFD